MGDNNTPMTTMPTAEIQALIAQVQNLTRLVQENTDSKPDISQITRRGAKPGTATVLFLDTKPVIGMENVGTDANPTRLFEIPDVRDPKKYILSANLIVKDLVSGEKETIRNVNFLEFIQECERKNCPIVKIIKNEWVIDQGITTKRELKEGDNYQMTETGVETPMEVTGVDNVYVMDINGVEVEIQDAYVNMAKASKRNEKQFISSIE